MPGAGPSPWKACLAHSCPGDTCLAENHASPCRCRWQVVGSPLCCCLESGHQCRSLTAQRAGEQCQPQPHQHRLPLPRWPRAVEHRPAPSAVDLITGKPALVPGPPAKEVTLQGHTGGTGQGCAEPCLPTSKPHASHQAAGFRLHVFLSGDIMPGSPGDTGPGLVVHRGHTWPPSSPRLSEWMTD